MQNARRMRRQKKERVLVRTVALMNLLVIGLATGCGGGDQRESVPPARNSGKEQKAQRLSPTAEFRKAVLDLQPGEKVRDVEIDEQPGGGYAISASFESGQSLTLGAGLGRSLIESDMKETYRVLYTSRNASQIEEASLTAYAPVVDQYGNETPAVVYSTTLDGVTGRKINWDSFPTLDFDSLWVVTERNPSFEQE
jgi:hypothetical protein